MNLRSQLYLQLEQGKNAINDLILSLEKRQKRPDIFSGATVGLLPFLKKCRFDLALILRSKNTSQSLITYLKSIVQRLNICVNRLHNARKHYPQLFNELHQVLESYYQNFLSMLPGHEALQLELLAVEEIDQSTPKPILEQVKRYLDYWLEQISLVKEQVKGRVVNVIVTRWEQVRRKVTQLKLWVQPDYQQLALIL